ncbi:MAG: ABC transporter ATP-binding protein [Emergencia timonensis]
MIQFRGVTKEFKGNVVLSDISMDINDGELTVLIGPSGCGKTTTLKMINRLIPASKGEIFIDEKNIEEMDKVQLRRNMGYVIQQGGLFPHMTIRQNIEIIERLEKKDTEKIVENTKQLMKMVDLDPDQFLDRYPTELSGGQRQRIGVIRALANDPEIILLDEPFSALDPVTRSSLQDELIELQSKVGKTMVFVTHDMDEAIKIADRICIMKGGHILQFDTPEMILKQPADEFVANFVGTNRIWDSPEYIKVEDFMIKNPITCKGDMIRNRCIMHERSSHRYAAGGRRREKTARHRRQKKSV